MSGGTPPDLRKAAIDWYLLLGSGTATEGDRLRWRQWLEGSPRHQEAWARMESMRAVLQSVPAHVAAPALRARQDGRRSVLRLSAMVLTGGAAASLAWPLAREDGWLRRWTADHRTDAGERRALVLEDGSRLVLNTRSSVNIAFDGQRRLVRLVAGEISVQTAKAPAGRPAEPRPFLVQTPEGTVQALGTRFTVRSERGRSVVAVQQDRVVVRVDGLPGTAAVAAGEQLVFSRTALGTAQPASDGVAAWEQGSLLASDMRLGDLVEELARYRPGYLACDPAAGDLRVSGAFPLDDTDRALSVLARSLPIQIRHRTRYWVRVERAAD
ncbi:FecR domain-containing protein [Paracidovorax anthurii]|uniref:FecR family protein n=1 Tax=Paracidovorax anthurii TaxID=78229 RepID=A0A328ZDJ8_9BURK|nr:FecR domain-containing protein [Paracidovorax anthurii]RAR83949.1 FecR family protein [Paracidovorax anthurii]